jgi:hypothetical protein
LSQIEKLSEIKPPLVGSFSWDFLDQTVYLTPPLWRDLVKIFDDKVVTYLIFFLGTH